MENFLISNLRDDARDLDRGGWVVGSFFTSGQGIPDPHFSEALEVKYWKYPVGGGSDHGEKISLTTEWTLLLTGKLLSSINGVIYTLVSGQYVLIHPNVRNNLVHRVVEEVSAITIKAPSNPEAKKELK